MVQRLYWPKFVLNSSGKADHHHTMEDIEELGHPSRNIPNEAYPDYMPRPKANPDDLPLPDQANPADLPLPDEEYPDDMLDAGIERPAQVATPNQVPLSLHSFIHGRRSPTNVGLSSSGNVHDRRNPLLLPHERSPHRSPQRSPERSLQGTPPPPYLEPEPGIEMMPLQTVTQAGPVQPGQSQQQRNEPPVLANAAHPQGFFVPEGEVVGAPRRRTRKDWKAIGIVGGFIFVIGSLIIIIATVNREKTEK